ITTCFTTTPARRYSRRAGNQTAPGAGRGHGADRSDLLSGERRAHPPQRETLGSPAPTASLPRPHKTLDNFDFTFNPKMNRSLVFDLATCAFIGKREDALFLGPGGTGKSHRARAIGQAALQQGYRVMYRETHVLLDDLAESVADGTRKQFMQSVASVPLLIVDDFGMRKLPMTAAEDLLEITAVQISGLTARWKARGARPTRG